jgi:hypothetical protein
MPDHAPPDGPSDLIAALVDLKARVERAGDSWGNVLREADALPPLMGNAEAADALGVKTSNVGKVSGLASVYDLTRGALFLTDDVAAAVRRRRERSVAAAR